MVAETDQFFRQEPVEALVPTMYSGFFAHSPAAAHLGHISSSSWQPPVLAFGKPEDQDRTWIHFVADHFSPSMTGQLPCRLFVSVVALGWRLKNSNASPFTGLTANTKLTSQMGKLTFRQIVPKTLFFLS